LHGSIESKERDPWAPWRNPWPLEAPVPTCREKRDKWGTRSELINTRNLFTYLRLASLGDSISFRPSGRDALENLFCLRCNREIEVGHKSVAVYMFAQTVGIRPRQKSSAQRICFCPQCSVSLAMGPPPEGALNLAAWNMIRDLVGADPALNQAAWESLRGVAGLLPSSEPESIPRRAAAGGYFEF
jgi:hypothetical protein